MWQDEFIYSLCRPPAPPPQGIRRSDGQSANKRFDVYRNNVFSSLVNNLHDGYGAVAKLLGEEYFKAVAAAYANTHLPQSPVMVFYGENFGDFLDSFPPLADYPYLGDVARLEYARRLALHCADAPMIDRQFLTTIDPENLLQMQFFLHPSLQLIESRFPVLSIWRQQLENSDLPIPENGEDILITRPDMQIEMNFLPAGGAAFISALIGGSILQEAATISLAVNSEAKLDNLIQLALSLCVSLKNLKDL